MFTILHRRWADLTRLLFALLAAVVAETAVAGAASVVVFGDSIAAGNALPPTERDRTWVVRVEQLSLGRLHMINEGKPGRWTSASDEFAEMLARYSHIDALVIALGTNDSGDLSQTAVKAAADHLRSMIELARARRARLPILIVAPPDLRRDRLRAGKEIGQRREAQLRALDTAFEHLSGEMGCAFASLHEVVPNGSLAVDGMHPDAAGNEAIARYLLPRLLAILEPGT